MRHLYNHHVFTALDPQTPIYAQPTSSATDALEVVATDKLGPGNAHHRYEIRGFDGSKHPSFNGESPDMESLQILFQQGNVLEYGPNGITIEALLTVIADRLQGFQSGPFANTYNARALHHTQQALTALHERTRDRITRNVEGKLTS